MLPSSLKQNLISTGNETFDRFLGGGLLNSSLNLFERQGPSSRYLDDVWYKSLASSTLTAKNNLIIINFRPQYPAKVNRFLESLPASRKVKSELLYKDVRGTTAHAKIKIAWRYSNRGFSPSDNIARVNQVDFGIALLSENEDTELGQCRFLDVDSSDFSIAKFLTDLEHVIAEMKSSESATNVIIKDFSHPLNPMKADAQQMLKLMYALRYLSRKLEKGYILISYDRDMFPDHSDLKANLYNIADCVVSFYGYKTGENVERGYKEIDGTIEYVKVPKINSFGFHFQQDLSDWGYRLTKNHRFFVVDELSLPPCDDGDDEEKVKKRNVSDIHGKIAPLKQVGPLEDFKEVAKEVFTKRL